MNLLNKRKTRIISKYSVLICLTFILILEIGLRITSSHKLKRFKRCNYTVDSILGYKYMPSSKGKKITAAFENEYQINKQGFNWKDFPSTKKNGVFRIILMGDSDDTGIESNGPNSYAKLLQEKFDRNKDKVEILNFSTDGVDRVPFKMDYTYRLIQKYKPDLILFKIQFPVKSRKEYRTTYKGIQISFFDDKENLQKTKDYIDNKILNPPFISSLYKISYIYRYICKFYIENSKHKVSKFLKNAFFKNRKDVRGYVRRRITLSKPQVKKYSVLESFNFYCQAQDSIRKLGSKLLLFDTYGNDNYVKQLLYNHEKLEHNDTFNFLNLRIERTEDYYFGKLDGHTNQFGHGVIADSLYNRLILLDEMSK